MDGLKKFKMVKPNQNIFTKYKEMYLINSYRNATAPIVLPANTFIGGVASVINTPALLAAKLQNYPSGTAFDEANITNFTTNGSDISCYIGVDYRINNSSPFTAASIGDILTYYYDNERLKSMINSFNGQTNLKYLDLLGLINIGTNSYSLHGCTNLKILNFPNLLTWNDTSSIQYPETIEIINIARCTTLGAVNDNNMFHYTKLGIKIYANPYLQTNNAGGLEGDLVDFTNITWVTNFTAPNPITDLSVGTIYGTAIRLNFTAPTGSTNAIDFYEVYVNGFYKRRIVSGGYVTGLTLNTTYNIEVKPVDIYYNKSTSNIVNVTTNATYTIPTANIVSYYKMENNVFDSIGTNNGTATAITYEAGAVGQRAVFDGASSKIVIPDSNNLSFTDGTNDLPFSFSFQFMTNNVSVNQMIINKLNSAREYYLYLVGGKLRFFLEGPASNSIYVETSAFTFVNGTFYNIIVTYDGSKSVNGLKININEIEQTTTKVSTGTYTGMVNGGDAVVIGTHGNQTTAQYLNGKLDEVSIWNTALTEGQILEINAKLNSGQSLI